MPNDPENKPRGAGVENGRSLAHTEAGETKAYGAPLESATRFLRVAVAAAVVFQLFILVAMILGRTVPFVGAQTVRGGPRYRRRPTVAAWLCALRQTGGWECRLGRTRILRLMMAMKSVPA